MIIWDNDTETISTQHWQHASSPVIPACWHQDWCRRASASSLLTSGALSMSLHWLFVEPHQHAWPRRRLCSRLPGKLFSLDDGGQRDFSHLLSTSPNRAGWSQWRWNRGRWVRTQQRPYLCGVWSTKSSAQQASSYARPGALSKDGPMLRTGSVGFGEVPWPGVGALCDFPTPDGCGEGS